jgi:localization factor PodJL
MTVGASRRTQGIDPKTRELAETLARQAGLSLSDWLAGMAGPQTPDDALSHDDFDAPGGAAGYLETPRMKTGLPGRFEAPDHPGDELAKMTLALERLSERIEAAEARSTAAIAGVERTVRGTLTRLGDAEREQVAVAARFGGAILEAQTEQSRVAERLARIEDEARGPRSAEALHSLEAALGKVAGQLYEGEDRSAKALAEVRARIDRVESAGDGSGAIVEAVVGRIGERLEEAEARTTSALRALQLSFAAMDARLISLEDDPQDGEHPAPLEQMAADLAQRVDAARTEMDERLRLTAEGQFDRVDKALGQMTEHVRVAEQRSAQAIERMGREVVDMAGVLVRRVQGVEHRSADAIEQVGGEIARIAQSMDSRLGRADAVQAQALEKLGGEIARITERLAERIGNSERRSAAAIDEVGDQVARVTERLSQRHERTSDELAERIRLSEERTARFLEEARQTIEGLSRAGPANGADAAYARVPSEDEPIYGEDPFALFHPSPAADSPSAGAAAESESPSEPGADTNATFETETGIETDDGFQATSGPAHGDAAEADEESAVEASPDTNWSSPFGRGRLDVADDFAPSQAAGALFAGASTPIPQEADSEGAWGHAGEPGDEYARPDDVPAAGPLGGELEALAQDGAAAPSADWSSLLTNREAAERVRMAALTSGARPSRVEGLSDRPSGAPGQLFHYLPFERRPRRHRRAAGPTALGVGLAAAFGVALGGFWVVEDAPQGALSHKIAQLFGVGPIPRQSRTAPNAFALGPRPSPVAASPLVAVALAPTRIGALPPALAAGPSAAQVDDLAHQYAGAVTRLAGADRSGLADLRRLAAQGYAPAQFYLAKLFETGADGLKKDPAQARMWTQRAAEGGEAKAMHNLALDYFEGAGGPKNATLAAQWFRKAADLGLEDSQYNLGRLYEEGFGVAQNAAEAYKWYLIAARSGDAEAQAAAARLKATLSPQAKSTAERTAVAYRPAAPGANPAATASAAPAANLVTAQRALSALGYYQGPTDGAPSPALRLALSAYQRDQGLPATGAADANTVGKLSAFTTPAPPS